MLCSLVTAGACFDSRAAVCSSMKLNVCRKFLFLATFRTCETLSTKILAEIKKKEGWNLTWLFIINIKTKHFIHNVCWMCLENIRLHLNKACSLLIMICSRRSRNSTCLGEFSRGRTANRGSKYSAPRWDRSRRNQARMVSNESLSFCKESRVSGSFSFRNSKNWRYWSMVIKLAGSLSTDFVSMPWYLFKEQYGVRKNSKKLYSIIFSNSITEK